MTDRLTEFVTGLHDRLYSWFVFTVIVSVVIWCVICEVINARR